MKTRLLVLSLLVLTALIASVTAAGAQLDARDDPNTTEDLYVDEGPAKRCEKDKDFTESGTPAVVSRACTFVFQLRARSDKDPNRDYRVLWLQSSIHPRRDFCVTNVVSEIRFPEGYRVESKTPRFKRTDSRKKVKAKIRVDAGGGRQNDQVIKQNFGLYPRSLKPDMRDNSLVVQWKGAADRDLGFAMGVQVSFPTGDLPKGRAHGEVDSVLKSSC